MSENILFADMRSTIVRILEDWGLFMVEVPATPPVFRPEEPLLVSSIRFRGPIQGEFRFLCQRPFAEALSSNLLGSDSPVDERVLADALREMANVMSGNLLTSSFGEDAVFDLSSPEVQNATVAQGADLLGSRPFVVTADDEALGVSLVVEG